MECSLIRGLVGNRSILRERGGIALMMLVAFVSLAVPIVTGATVLAGTLSRSSQVYDSRLTAMYNSGSGVEAALNKILTDPNFDAGLTPTNPDKQITVDVNGETISVTITKIFSSAPLQGQGLVISKVVSPTSAPVDTATTYTYTITIKNKGSNTSTLEQVVDYLPPGLTYEVGSTSGLIIADPVVDVGPTIETDFWYLNNDAGLPYPLGTSMGSDAITGSHTPAQNTWEEVPEYWESAPFAGGGSIPATQWGQRQRIRRTTNIGTGDWRWKAQLVRGAQIIDLFTSASSPLNTSWSYKNINHIAGSFSIQAGDKVRIRLEVRSPNASPADRVFEYRWGGAFNYRSRTNVPALFVRNCDDNPRRLTWDLSPFEQLGSGEQVTLTFRANATLGDGTHYNQAKARYDPWWVSPDLEIWTPYTAAITVGSGTTKCGYDLEALVNKVVVPPNGTPGVEAEFTYTISVENTSGGTRYVCQIDDLLPPDYTYVSGSSGDDPANIATFEPPSSQQHGLWFDPGSGRWRIRWKIGTEDQAPPMATLGPGETRTQVFRARTTPAVGTDYFNEVNVIYALELDANGECDIPDLVEQGQGGTGQGGAGNGARVTTPRIYDIQAVAADGSVLARIQYTHSTAQLDILSWQQY